ncbi:MAG: hypothetical protein U0736_23700 [Gemmataceae bacterium]
MAKPDTSEPIAATAGRCGRRRAATVTWAKARGPRSVPTLTGSQRTNPEYIALKVLDPNAVVPRDFQVTRVVTETGRVLTGLIKSENDRVLVLQTPTEEVRVLKSDIETRDRLTQSLMPEGQLQTLTDVEIRDLLAYLAGAGQVPLPKKEDSPQSCHAARRHPEPMKMGAY